MRTELNTHGFELSYRDEMGHPKASAIETVTHIFVSREVSRWVLENVGWSIVERYFIRMLVLTANKIKSFGTEPTKESVSSISTKGQLIFMYL